MNLYIPFIHKILKKEKQPTQLPLYIEKEPRTIEKKEKEEKETVITIELF